MELITQHPLIFLLVTLNYLLVIVSLLHLIFKSDYPVGWRLCWMVALWLVPALGLLAYWIVWSRRSA